MGSIILGSFIGTIIGALFIEVVYQIKNYFLKKRLTQYLEKLEKDLAQMYSDAIERSKQEFDYDDYINEPEKKSKPSLN